MGGAHHHAGAGERCGGRGLGDTKVGDFHLAVLGDEQVAGLDIPVNEATFMDGGQAVGGLLQNIEGVGLQERPFPNEHVR